MNDDEKLQLLINKLIEHIQSSIQDSTRVHSILKEIEQQGIMLNLSMLIGIFIRDKNGVDMFFSSLGEEGKTRRFKKKSQKVEETQEDSAPMPSSGNWTDQDREFLDSLGIHFLNSEEEQQSE